MSAFSDALKKTGSFTLEMKLYEMKVILKQ